MEVLKLVVDMNGIEISGSYVWKDIYNGENNLNRNLPPTHHDYFHPLFGFYSSTVFKEALLVAAMNDKQSSKLCGKFDIGV